MSLFHIRVCWKPILGMLLASNAMAQAANPVEKPTDEPAFLAANDLAMTRMMSGMAVKPTGDVDADFAAMMIPHHQGAIDMAMAELRFGHDEKLRRIAQEIIVDQQQEIAAMRLALDQKQALSKPAPVAGEAGASQKPDPDAPRQPMAMPMEHAR